MNIRKQLDDLKKDDRAEMEHYGKLAREDMKVSEEMIDEAIEALGNLFNIEHMIPPKEYHEIVKVHKLLSKLIPDPKGDISNVGRDKLDEWARRNQKIDTEEPEEEKVWGVVGALAGDDE